MKDIEKLALTQCQKSVRFFIHTGNILLCLSVKSILGIKNTKDKKQKKNLKQNEDPPPKKRRSNQFHCIKNVLRKFNDQANMVEGVCNLRGKNLSAVKKAVKKSNLYF